MSKPTKWALNVQVVRGPTVIVYPMITSGDYTKFEMAI
jgi:hypothetical protein